MMINFKKQTGVVLLVTLIALVIIMIASIALIRSTEANSLIAGNIGFKRDLVNQAERAMPTIRSKFLSGTLSTLAARQSSLASENYSALVLPTNASGIPTALMDTATFDSTYTANNITDSVSGVTIRYVIDRTCFAATTFNAINCIVGSSIVDFGGGVKQIQGAFGGGGKIKGEEAAIYRISMRVSGPKNVETFVQTTFTL
jgi:type IV pilus assembly protein PilX